MQAAKLWESKHWDFNASRVKFYRVTMQEQLKDVLDKTIEKQLAVTSDPEAKKMNVEYCTEENRERMIAESALSAEEKGKLHAETKRAKRAEQKGESE